MTRYLLSRTLMAVFVFMALRASLWAAAGHSGVLPVLVWAALALIAWSLCPESLEGHAEPEA